MVGRALSRVERLPKEDEERRLLLVGRGEVAGPGDLVESETGGAGRAGVLGERVRVVPPLPDRDPDALPRGAGEVAGAKLGAQAGVGAERGGGLGEHAEELGDDAAGGLDALDQGSAPLRRGELVVDV